MTEEYILFSADDLKLCVKASTVHGIHDGVVTQPEVGTQAWFAGVAVVDGRLLPITDLSAYLGRKPAHGRVIEVAHSLGIAGLLVDEVHGVSSEYDADTYEFLDLAQLVQSDQFLDIPA